MTMANVTAGFRVTGIYPLNRNVLSLDTSVAKLSQETGLFLPTTENLALVKEKERQKEEKQRKKEERERKKKEREEAKFGDTMKGSL